MAVATGSPLRMRFRLNLRGRVALGFALLGAVICLAIAVGLDATTDELEDRLLQDTLYAELADAEAHLQLRPGTPLPTTATVLRYVEADGDSSQIPRALRALGAGFHEVQIGGTIYAAAVSQHGPRRLFVLYDKTALLQHERGLHLFLVSGILTMALLSAVGGRWLAARVIAPVTVLARRVVALPPGAPAGRLARDFAHDEVGELAREIDSYVERLADAMEREKCFTGDVSHELRSSLAVIQGAVDVLRDHPELPPSALRPLERIARSTSVMQEISNALLNLARAEAGVCCETGPVDVVALAQELIESHRPLLNGKPVRLDLVAAAPLCVQGDRAAVRMTLGNLIRNACFFTRQGEVKVRIDSRGVLIEDTGVGLDQGQLDRALDRGVRDPASAGAGIGLSLTRRLCERNGWRLSLESRKGRGTRVRVELLQSGRDSPERSVIRHGREPPAESRCRPPGAAPCDGQRASPPRGEDDRLPR